MAAVLLVVAVVVAVIVPIQFGTLRSEMGSWWHHLHRRRSTIRRNCSSRFLAMPALHHPHPCQTSRLLLPLAFSSSKQQYLHLVSHKHSLGRVLQVPESVAVVPGVLQTPRTAS
jgi:hypothetical protein